MVGAPGNPRLPTTALVLSIAVLVSASLVGLAPALAQSPLQPLCDEIVDLEPLCEATGTVPNPLAELEGIGPAGDGFVAAFRLPTAGDLPAPTILLPTGNGMSVQVHPRELVGDAWVAYDGPLILYLQRDCGALAEALVVADCQGNLETVASDQAVAAGGTADFQFTAEQLAGLMAPADALHLFVETPDLRYSHYNVATEVAGVADAAAADALEEATFTPVLVVQAPIPDGAGSGDDFVAHIALPAATPLGDLPALNAEASSFQVTVYLGPEFAAAPSGSFNLVLQVDCGELRAVVPEDAVACAGGADATTKTVVLPFTATGTAVSVPVSAAQLALLLGDLPLTALHVFVEGNLGATYVHSNYAASTAALLAAGGAAAAAAVDLVDATLWHPVLLLGAAGLPPGGDDFVAGFTLPALGPVPVGLPVLVWDGGDVQVAVDARILTSGTWGPYSGALLLVAQRDCGSLEEVLADADMCQTTYDAVASDTETAADGQAVFTLAAADLADGAMEPGDVLHLFVQATPQQYSHYNAIKESAFEAGEYDAADAIEEITFSPVLLAQAGVPIDDVPVGGDGTYAQWGATFQKTLANLENGDLPLVLKYDATGALHLDGQLFSGTDFAPAGEGLAQVFLELDCGGIAQLPEAGPALCDGVGVSGQQVHAVAATDSTGHFEVTFASGTLAPLFLPADGLLQSLGALPVNLFVTHTSWVGQDGPSFSSFNAAAHVVYGASGGALAPVADLLSDTTFTPLLLPPPPGLGVPLDPSEAPLGDGAYAQWGGNLTKALGNMAGSQTLPYVLHYTGSVLHLDGIAYGADGQPVGPGTATVYLEVDCGGIAEVAPDLCSAAGVAGDPLSSLATTGPDGAFAADFRAGDLAALFANQAGIAASGFVPVNVFVTHSGWSPQGPAVYSHFNAAAHAIFGASEGASLAVSDAVADLAFTPLLLPEPPAVAPLGKVLGLQAEADLDEPAIDLDWQGVAGATEYEVHRGTPDFLPTPATLIATVTGLAHRDSGLLTGTTYYYRIVAVNSAQRGESSDIASAQTMGPADETPPGEVPGFTATAKSTSRILLQWGSAADVPAGPVGWYSVARSPDQMILANVTGLSWDHAGLQPGSTHAYQVRAVDSAGNPGPWSPVESATTLLAQSSSGPTSGSEGAAGGPPAQTQPMTVTTTATSTSTPPPTPTPTATPPPTSTPTPAAPAPAAPATPADPQPASVAAPEEVTVFNEAIGIVVERSGDTNVVSWVLPEQPPAPVAGVQVWRSNSPYVLVGTFDADSEEFRSGRLADDDATGAKPTTKYLVTAYFGLSRTLGFYDGEAPAEDNKLGTAASTAEVEPSSGAPAILIGVAGILAALLVVLVLVLVVRRLGRGSDGRGGQA